MRRRSWLPLLVAGAILVVAIVMTLFNGPLPSWLHQRFTAALPGTLRGLLELAVVLILFVIGAVFLREGNTETDQLEPLVTDQPPEEAQNAPRVIGDQFDTARQEAVRSIRQGNPADEMEPEQTLRDVVQRGIRLRQQCTEDQAREHVEEGAWTDDPVAQAFLSEQCEYPPTHQLLRWAQTDAAYERAVNRTANAVDQFIQTAFGTGMGQSEESSETTADMLDNSQPPDQPDDSTGELKRRADD